jgi:uncharacterized protein Yka (UPF0111/DUF47 family)
VKFPFIPREEKFFDLFQASAQNVVVAAHRLKEMVDDWKNVEASAAEITELEHRGDTITHDIIARVHRTIVELAHSLDDIIDFIHAAADSMFLYKVDRPGSRAKELAEIIVQATEEVERVIPQLKKRIVLSQVLKRCVEINRLENVADRVYRSAIAELFADSPDIAEVIKWREIYAHMESATDRCEDVANVLEGVALKHA